MSETRPIFSLPADADESETAAIVATLSLLIAENETRPQPTKPSSPAWSQAAKAEQQGLKAKRNRDLRWSIADRL